MTFVGADSLRFSPKLSTQSKATPPLVFKSKHKDEPTGITLALTDVHEVRIVHRSTAAQVANGVLLTVGVAAVFAGVALATKESCPFLYSFDGENFVFDGEPYGGATMESLQRTDWSELEHLREVDGQFRLMVGNEVDETQHTDALELMVVDHDPDTWVVMDVDGEVHAFRDRVALQRATDEHGNDLTSWLSDQGHAVWYPDLAHYASVESLGDTRNHITLEFPRPEGVREAFLVSNVGTGQWGSHMIRVMLAMRGNQLGEFYEAINGSADARDQLRMWNEREDLFTMHVEQMTADGWVDAGLLHGGGPFMRENRAMTLDLASVEGDVVRLRISPPIGFWQLDSFHLAWDSSTPSVQTVQASHGVDNTGRDVRAILEAVDGVTLDMPTTNDHAMLTFVAPGQSPGTSRTIFAKSTGWYQLHLDPQGPPEAEALRRLAFEPGYAVRRALSDFASFMETGVLARTSGHEQD